MSMDTQLVSYNNREYTNGSQPNNNNSEPESPGDIVEAAGCQGLNLDHGFITEIEAYQGLMLDFEREYSEFLSSDLPKCPTEESIDDDREDEGLNQEGNRSRRSSKAENNRRGSGANSSRSSFDGSGTTEGGIRYNFDGTISCCDLSYDLLCSLSNRSSLEHLTTLTIAVAAQNSSDNLRIIAASIRNLTTLKLDNSRIQSLRVLGEEMRNLKTLSVCYCGLTDLDGINNAPNLVNLVAAFNAISDVYPITEMRRINTLDLECNAFDEFSSVSFLFICPKLDNLVLKGNEISRRRDYRQKIFRMLPHLKNLDVIVTPRPPRFCRKNTLNDNDQNDDDAENGAAPTTVSDIPQELEGYVEEESKPKEEDPLSNEIIQQLIKDGSDDKVEEDQEPPTADTGKEEVEAPNADVEEETSDITNETTEEETVETMRNAEKDQVQIDSPDSSDEDVQPYLEEPSNLKEDIDHNITKDCEEYFKPETTESYNDNNEEEDTEKEGEDLTEDEKEMKEKVDVSPEPHKPIIMERRKTLEYSPSFAPSVKLLGKRQSVDPVRIKLGGLSNVPDITKKPTDYVPSEARIPSIASALVARDKGMRPPSRKEMAKSILPPDQPRPFVTTPNPGRSRALMEAPNLTKLMASHEKSPGNRPDSATSSSTSTTTASCSYSLSEADSGVSDLSSGSRRSSGIQGTYEPIERLKERKGAGFAEGGALETPSKRTKKTDKAKLVRQNSNLTGKLTTEGDVEIEDFD